MAITDANGFTSCGDAWATTLPTTRLGAALVGRTIGSGEGVDVEEAIEDGATREDNDDAAKVFRCCSLDRRKLLLVPSGMPKLPMQLMTVPMSDWCSRLGHY